MTKKRNLKAAWIESNGTRIYIDLGRVRRSANVGPKPEDGSEQDQCEECGADLTHTMEWRQGIREIVAGVVVPFEIECDRRRDGCGAAFRVHTQVSTVEVMS